MTRTFTFWGTSTSRAPTPTRTSISAGLAAVAPGALTFFRSSFASPTPRLYSVLVVTAPGVQVRSPAQVTVPVLLAAPRVTIASRMPTGARPPARRPSTPASSTPRATTPSATAAATAPAGAPIPTRRSSTSTAAAESRAMPSATRVSACDGRVRSGRGGVRTATGGGGATSVAVVAGGVPYGGRGADADGTGSAATVSGPKLSGPVLVDGAPAGAAGSSPVGAPEGDPSWGAGGVGADGVQVLPDAGELGPSGSLEFPCQPPCQPPGPCGPRRCRPPANHQMANTISATMKMPPPNGRGPYQPS